VRGYHAFSYQAEAATPREGTPRSTPSSRSGQTSALLERISRLQARLNERVSLAGLANSLAHDKRKPETLNLDEKDRSREPARYFLKENAVACQCLREFQLAGRGRS